MKPAVLITGAGRGLGLCLVQRFLEKGFSVFAGIRRKSASLDLLAHVELHPVALDVTDDRSVSDAAAAVKSAAGSLDTLINNAAICEDEGGTIETIEVARVMKILEVNACGPLRVTREFLPLLRAGTMKTIVNVSSEAGSVSDGWRKGMFGYCMSKAGLNMQSKLLHNYLRDDGFRVLSIHPGWMRTDMGGKNADIEPLEAATGIVDIVMNQTDSGKNLFVDYKGRALRY